MPRRYIVSLFTAGILFVLAGLSRAEVRGPQAYGCAYQNITSDRDEEGFIQLYGMAINKTQIYVLGDNRTFIQSDIVSMAGLGPADSYNYTPVYSNTLLRADPVGMGSSRINNFGMILSADQPCSLMAGKSDLGTSDAYLLLPQTNNSVRFMIAAWERIAGEPFLGMIMVIPVLDGTCVELYSIYQGVYYYQITSEIIGKFQMFRYFAAFATTYNPASGYPVQNFSKGEDMTGMMVNSSKPVQVIVGMECSWIPTTDNFFCDYMADTMPPVNQLGLINIFAPIYGRSTKAGYIGRIVPSQDLTTITVMLNPPVTVTKRLGEFYQFDAPDAGQPVAVICDKPCLAVQYNKGWQNYNDVPTDPYMVTIVPADRFTAGAPFGTANFCEDKNELTDFDNYISIVTFDGCKDNILYDGSPIADEFSAGGSGSGGWIPLTAGGMKFAVGGFHVDPGFHYVSMSAGVDCSFVVYVYGHSMNPDSSSGYGYFANFNSTGQPVPSVFSESKVIVDKSGGAPDRNTTCNSEAYLTGSILSSNSGDYVSFPFYEEAGIKPGQQMSDICLAQYHDNLLQLLRDFSRKINYWICISQNCSYLGGDGVAINYPTLDVQYQKSSGGIVKSVSIYVEMIARMDVTADNFAQCRAEIQNYMHFFVNWPPAYTPDLLHQAVSGCPWPFPFQESMFTAKPIQCLGSNNVVILA